MRAAIWVQDSFRALPRYLLVLTAVSALALLARAAVPSSDDLRSAHTAASASSVSALPAPALPASAPLSAAVAPYPAQIAAVSPIPAFAARTSPVFASQTNSRLSPAYPRYATATKAPFAETR